MNSLPKIPIASGLYGLVCVALMASTVVAQNSRLSIPSARLQPSEQPRASVQAFVESVKGNDAALEVTVGQGKLLTLRQKLATEEEGGAVIAVGDPTVLDFEVIGLKQIRLIGQRIGTTDLSVTTADDQNYAFEVRVVADMRTLHAKLRAFFPDSSVQVTQVADHIVIEGQARSTAQIEQILQTVQAWLTSLQASQTRRVTGRQTDPRDSAAGSQATANEDEDSLTPVEPDLQISGTVPQSEIINLMTVPGSQQVMLKVQIAELNRTGLRRMGANFLHTDGTSFTATRPTGESSLVEFLAGDTNPTTTLAGVISDGGGSVNYFIDALRRNSILKILAEPTLVAYNGHEATFLAGGEFPVPVPQPGAGGNAITIEFKEFGVRLGFLPTIMEDDRIRLTVSPEVSALDRSVTAIVQAGEIEFAVPGLSTRRSNTTVEMRSGQTLALAGLLQVTLENQTNRIPGIGDLPVLGPFFSNNTGERTEKELIVMVSPFLVEPTDAAEASCLPGQEVNEPNDLEFYLLGRIEGRTGKDFRSTTKWDDPLGLTRKLKLHQRYMCGPCGYSE